jgi:hypothetical protein
MDTVATTAVITAVLGLLEDNNQATMLALRTGLLTVAVATAVLDYKRV